MASIGRTLSSVRCDASRSARKSSTANISGGLSISVGFAVNATGLKSIVTACRAGDGQLLLISWQLKADGTLTRLADSGTGAEDIGKARCVGHFSERRVPPPTRRQRLGGLLHEVQGKDA